MIADDAEAHGRETPPIQTVTDSKSQNAIDENLKRVYQPIPDEDVPDRFKDLLARLKEADAVKVDNE